MTIVYMYDRQYIPYPSPSSSSSSLLPYSPSLLPWNSSPPSLDSVFLSERPAISTSPVFIPIWKVTLLTKIEWSNWLMGHMTQGAPLVALFHTKKGHSGMAHISVDAYYKAVIHMNEGAYVILTKKALVAFSQRQPTKNRHTLKVNLHSVHLSL